MSKLSKAVPMQTDSALSSGNVSRASFGGMHLWGYAIATVAERRVLQEQRRVAEDYYDIAKKAFDHWESTYKTREVDYKSEGMSAPFVVPNYRNYANARVHNLPTILKEEHAALSGTRGWETGRKRAINVRSRKLQMRALVSGRALQYRLNYAIAERENIKRMARRQAVANLGIQAGNGAAAGFGRSAGDFINAGNNLASRIGALRQGFGQAMGFNARLNQE